MPDCKTCKESHQNIEPVPYIVHEASEARYERTIKRLWIALMVSIVLWAVTVAGIVYYKSQFEDVTITAEQEADGDSSNYAVGVDYYGWPESNNAD